MKRLVLAPLLSLVPAIALSLTLTAAPAAAQSGGGEAHAKASARMIAALEIHEGSIVAEMGAGAGGRSIDVAKHVGPTGRVYSSEMDGHSVRNLRDGIEKSDAKNVTVVVAQATQTNFDEGCCRTCITTSRIRRR
jgi:precorrin-6B methylase 2